MGYWMTGISRLEMCTSNTPLVFTPNGESVVAVGSQRSSGVCILSIRTLMMMYDGLLEDWNTVMVYQAFGCPFVPQDTRRTGHGTLSERQGLHPNTPPAPSAVNFSCGLTIRRRTTVL